MSDKQSNSFNSRRNSNYSLSETKMLDVEKKFYKLNDPLYYNLEMLGEIRSR